VAREKPFLLQCGCRQEPKGGAQSAWRFTWLGISPCVIDEHRSRLPKALAAGEHYAKACAVRQTSVLIRWERNEYDVDESA
jgi:hypothetical protein